MAIQKNPKDNLELLAQAIMRVEEVAFTAEEIVEAVDCAVKSKEGHSYSLASGTRIRF